MPDTLIKGYRAYFGKVLPENVPVDKRHERVFRISRVEDHERGHSGRVREDLRAQGERTLRPSARPDLAPRDLLRVLTLFARERVIGLFLAEKLRDLGRGHSVDIRHCKTFPALFLLYAGI